MQFIVTARDGIDEGALQRRLAVREAHLALGATLAATGQHLYAAALLNEAGIMVGSVIICEYPSREALDEWLAQEPYVTGNVWQQIEVQPCRVGPSFQRR